MTAPLTTEKQQQTNAPADGPDDTGGVPADLSLPGQDDGRVEPPTDAGRLYDYICLDPRQQWTLGMGFVDARTVIHPRSAKAQVATIEKLAAYASPAAAVRAVRGLKVQVELCGDGVDHAGSPSTWQAAGTTRLRAADESVRLTYRSGGAVGAVVTVVRVGRAVFYIDRRAHHADGVATDERTVAAFIPTLATTFR